LITPLSAVQVRRGVVETLLARLEGEDLAIPLGIGVEMVGVLVAVAIVVGVRVKVGVLVNEAVAVVVRV